MAAIVGDEFVIIQEIGGEYDGHQTVLDLRRTDALVEYFTDRYSAERIRVKSWTGQADRDLSISDFRA